MVILAEALLGKGYSLLHLRQERLAGAAGRRQQGVHRQADPAPVVAALRHRSTRCIDESEVIVVGNGAPEFGEALTRTRADQIIIDLVRVKTPREQIKGDYRGICW